MLVPLVARASNGRGPQADAHPAWTAALHRLDATPDVALGDLAAYVEDVPEAERAEAAQDLIAAHMRRAWDTGAGEPLEAYLTALGEVLGPLASPERVPPDLVLDEFIARFGGRSEAPPLTAYAVRFGNREHVNAALRRRCLLEERYVLLCLLGRGAAGAVWEAHDRRLARRVALKTAGVDPAAGDLLVSEAHTGARLHHPGIVAIHDIHTPPDGAPFYTMRLLQGPTFGAALNDHHRPPPTRGPAERRLTQRRLVSAVATAAEAVAYAHERGVPHGDLTPGNIILAGGSGAVVLDWGGTCVGTPEYMAPEQASGPAGPASDVFGLGAILYEVLTSRPPRVWLGGLRPGDWRPVVAACDIPPPRRIRADVPADLAAVCERAVAAEAGQRYPGAAAMALDLRRWLAGVPVSTRPTPLWRRLLGG